MITIDKKDCIISILLVLVLFFGHYYFFGANADIEIRLQSVIDNNKSVGEKQQRVIDDQRKQIEDYQRAAERNNELGTIVQQVTGNSSRVRQGLKKLDREVRDERKIIDGSQQAIDAARQILANAEEIQQQ